MGRENVMTPTNTPKSQCCFQGNASHGLQVAGSARPEVSTGSLATFNRGIRISMGPV